MKRMLCLLGILVGVFGCSEKEGVDSSQIALPEAEPVVLDLIRPAPEAFEPIRAGQIAFDMVYRGLNGPDDDLFINTHYGYGGKLEDTPFIRDIKGHGIKNLHLVCNHEFKGAEISAVEISKRRAVAFYLDLDANGKVTANERITPLPSPQENSEPVRFLTPDFSFTNEEDQRVCSRALLSVRGLRRKSKPQMTWSPAAVLEGHTQLEGSPARFVLYGGLSGLFDEFGWTHASLQIGTDQMETRPRRNQLSQLMVIGERFYRVQLQRPSESTSALRVVLTEDRSPTGRVKAQLTLNGSATGEIRYAYVSGESEDDNINLRLPMTSMALPQGNYRLDHGGLCFAAEHEQWEVDFSGGPLITVQAGKENTVSLGKPTLALRALDNRERYRTNAKSKTVFKCGTQIYLNRELKGQAGEAYGRFRRVSKHERTDVMAHISIANPKGKQILSKDLEYG